MAKLATNVGHAFSNTNEIVAFTNLLNKSFANANTNVEGIASATLQLNQAKGKLQRMSLRMRCLNQC